MSSPAESPATSPSESSPPGSPAPSPQSAPSASSPSPPPATPTSSPTPALHPPTAAPPSAPSPPPAAFGAAPVLAPSATSASGPTETPARPWPTLDPGEQTAQTERIVIEDPDAPPPPTPEEHLLRRLLGERALRLDATIRARLWGWIAPLLVTAFAGLVRFQNLGRPQELVFDETYYVKQGYTYFREGFDAEWPEEYNPHFETGSLDGYLSTGDYVVHPPIGKWVIALGFHLGDPANAWTWRVTTAILGTLAVLMVARSARRLFASTSLGVLAGLLMAVDGQAIVHSRTALLDNTLMFFVLAAFGALLLDREQARRRLASRCAAQLEAVGDLSRWGPSLGIRWWRIVAALALGLAIGTKWSGLYFFAVFAVMSVMWDLAARRRAGVESWFASGIFKDGAVAAAVMIPVVAGTYLASWTSWFRNEHSWGRYWAQEHPGEGVTWLPDALRSWWKYHLDMWQFHNNLTSEHTYEAHPAGWVVQLRPTSFLWNDLPDPVQTCGWDRCVEAVLAIGNPLIWWGAALSIPVALFFLVVRRDWRAFAVLSGYVAGWLPWLAYAHRTIFTFYAIAFTPWVILTLTYALSKILGDAEGPPRRRDHGFVVVGVFLVLVLAVSAFFYPIWTAQTVPYRFWQLHMWWPTWV